MTGEKSKWNHAAPRESLTISEISTLLDPWLAGRSVVDAELLSGGLMNRNILLRLDGKPNDCVLRIYDRDPAACVCEVAVLGMVGRDLPVPRVLYSDEGAEQGAPVAVLSVVDGISLATLHSTHDDEAIAESAYDAGRVLARIGRYPGPPTPAETLLGLVERFARAPAFEQRVSPALRDALIDLVTRWLPRLVDLSSQSGLVHADFNSRNIFVRRTNEGWRVSGVLDWEFALNASPFVDVGNFLRYHRADRPRFEPHFSRGMRDAGVILPDDWLALARLMDLPALCELIGRTNIPESVAVELLSLLESTARLDGATLGV
jgi:aminoglycoside phosphotransferase (APT) family kinase protein